MLVQLVEIPGLIEGAAEDRGGGRSLLGVLRGADAIVLCHEASQATGLETIVATKTDDAPAPPGSLGESVPDDASLERLRAAICDERRQVGLGRCKLAFAAGHDRERCAHDSP